MPFVPTPISPPCSFVNIKLSNYRNFMLRNRILSTAGQHQLNTAPPDPHQARLLPDPTRPSGSLSPYRMNHCHPPNQSQILNRGISPHLCGSPNLLSSSQKMFVPNPKIQSQFQHKYPLPAAENHPIFCREIPPKHLFSSIKTLNPTTSPSPNNLMHPTPPSSYPCPPSNPHESPVHLLTNPNESIQPHHKSRDYTLRHHHPLSHTPKNHPNGNAYSILTDYSQFPTQINSSMNQNPSSFRCQSNQQHLSHLLQKYFSPKHTANRSYKHQGEEKTKFQSKRVSNTNSICALGSKQANHSSFSPSSISPSHSTLEKDMIRKVQSKRIFDYTMKYSIRSKRGFQNGNVKVNQDQCIALLKINKKNWKHFFGVCDGHGPNGRPVAQFIRMALTEELQQNQKDGLPPSIMLEQAFSRANYRLLSESGYDLSVSGSTVVGCYINRNKLYCANVGDSRVIIGKFSENHRLLTFEDSLRKISDRPSNKGEAHPQNKHYTANSSIQSTNLSIKAGQKWRTEALSTDHKPWNARQASRILMCRGRIEPYRNEEGKLTGPPRVWLPDIDLPGLAMTRSFGDTIAAEIGVISFPQIVEHELTDEDKIILIATDGIYEFLENEEIIEMLSEYYCKDKIQEGSEYLLKMAHKKWIGKANMVDDISFVLIFIKHRLSDP